MKKLIITSLALLIVSLSQVLGQTKITPVPPVPGASRIFVETFDGTTSDPKVWQGWTDRKGNKNQGLDAKYDILFPEYKNANSNFKFMNITFKTAMPGSTGNDPSNGEYVIAKSTVGAPYPPFWWGSTGTGAKQSVTNNPFFDHTYVHTGQTRTTANNQIAGYMLVINANSSGDVFFTCPIDSLCPNTHLIFRIYVGNLIAAGNTVKSDPTIQFDVYEPGATKGTIGKLLASSSTTKGYNGLVPKTASPVWQPKSFDFTTGNQSTVIVRISDTQSNTNGNDLVLDDIEVWSVPQGAPIISQNAWCLGDSISLDAAYDKAAIDTTYGSSAVIQWLFNTNPTDTITKWTPVPGTGGLLSDPNSTSCLVSKSALRSDTGYYRTVVGSNIDPTTTNNDYRCCGIELPFRVMIAPPDATLYWKLNPADQNWNNPDNWLDETGAAVDYAPSHCTDVHIPGNAPWYPSLDVVTSGPVSSCNDIWFHFGGLIGKPHLLDYHYAYVQYNFGTSDGKNNDYGYGFKGGNSTDFLRESSIVYSDTVMKRGRWYVLAAPLQKIAAGDFCVGGYPNMWQEAFKSSPNQLADQPARSMTTADWFTPDSTNAWDVGKQYNAIAVWAGEAGSGLPYGEGPAYQMNLDSLKGILEMPYFENDSLIKYHRLFSQVGDISKFQYYYYTVPGLDPAPKWGTITRGEEAYRFIFQGPPFNPAYLDANGDSIYTMPVPANTEIMVGNPFFSQLDFNAFAQDNGIDQYRLYIGDTPFAYSVTAGGPADIGGDAQFIAPLQAFLIIPSADSIVFNPNKIALANPNDNKLRSSNSNGNMKADVLYLNASSNAGQSWLTLSMQDVNEKNLILLLPAGYPNIPQIYATDETGQRNAIQFEGGYVNSVPLGVLSTDNAIVTLTVHNTENLPVDYLVLWDKYLDKKIDLLTTDTYVFQNVPSVSDRFVLLVGNKVITGITSSQIDNSVYANVSGNTLYVNAVSQIANVSVVSLQGVTISTDVNVGQNTYTKALNLPAGAYLVSVKLATGETKMVKVVKN